MYEILKGLAQILRSGVMVLRRWRQVDLWIQGQPYLPGEFQPAGQRNETLSQNKNLKKNAFLPILRGPMCRSREHSFALSIFHCLWPLPIVSLLKKQNNYFLLSKAKSLEPTQNSKENSLYKRQETWKRKVIGKTADLGLWTRGFRVK